MPHLIDTPSRTTTLVDAINTLLADGGPPALTMRALAQVSGVSTSSILHHYGSRDRLVRVAAYKTAERRLETILARVDPEGAVAFLPRTDDDVVEARAWLAWQELWRCEDGIGEAIQQARARERGLLAQVTDFALCRERLDEAFALLEGLRATVCTPRGSMRPDRARQLFTTHLRRSGAAGS